MTGTQSPGQGDLETKERHGDEKEGTPVKAVRFDEYGEVDVLKVVDVPRPALA
jgi:hypothetical protein